MVIALIDSSKKNEGFLSRLTSLVSEPIYSGHYILLTGADATHIHYLNPNTPGPQRLLHPAFDLCRRSRGTDEDLIFLD